MDDFRGTSSWLRQQWSNPSDIFTILLIIGGDIVRVAIAQLCAGPVSWLTPVAFSFGWVSYAVSSLMSAFGDNSLMPKPELDCLVIDAKSGYQRQNHSWVLSRMLRDFDHWKVGECDKIEAKKLNKLKETNDTEWQNYRKAEREGRDLPDRPKDPENVRIAMRVTMWDCLPYPSKCVSRDTVLYWSGLAVTLVQLVIAVIPWILWDEYFSFLLTATGTLLAYFSGGLPQWREEKLGVRTLGKNDEKRVFLTEGNGAKEVICLFMHGGGIDLEALAGSQRKKSNTLWTRCASSGLSLLWIAFLITVAGWQQHTWFLLGIGLTGIIHSVVVAGLPRRPRAYGIEYTHSGTIVAAKCMEVLWELEDELPGAGAALLPVFYPGTLRPREERLWEFAKRRAAAAKGRETGLWAMPSLYRTSGWNNDGDIPGPEPAITLSTALRSHRS